MGVGLSCGLAVAVSLAGVGGVWAQGVEPAAVRPTAEKILARVMEKDRERREALDRYTSERTYRVHYAGTGGEHDAEIKVHAEFTGPDQKRLTVVSETGSKFICEKVLRKMVEGEQEASDKSNQSRTRLSTENYEAEVVGEEAITTPDGGKAIQAWVLKVSPKVDNKFTYRGKVWISEDDYAVMKIEGEPGKSPSWWINQAAIDARYVKRGEIWLPAKNVSSSHVRIGGEAELTIDYGTYPVVAAR